MSTLDGSDEVDIARFMAGLIWQEGIKWAVEKFVEIGRNDLAVELVHFLTQKTIDIERASKKEV